jgi:hypothetical protein
MDAGETVRIDFVNDLTSGAATPTGFGYTGRTDSNDFIGHIPQVQGSQSETVAFTVYALDSSLTQSGTPDNNPTGGFADATVTTITDVTVIGFGATEQTPVTIDVSSFKGDGLFHAVAYGISVRINADGSATFSGVQEGDQYGFHTDTGTFNAVVVQANAAGTGGSTEDSFDLGVFAIGTVNQGHNIDMNFGVTGTDADGDTSTGNIAVTLTAVPISQATVQHTQVVSQTALDTSSLVNSNDNEHERGGNGHNTVMMGALAAAGLSVLDAGIGSHTSFSDLGHATLDRSSIEPTHVLSFDNEAAGGIVNSTHFSQSMVAPGSSPAPQGGGVVHDMVETSHALTTAGSAHAQSNTELLHGTTVPGQGGAATDAHMMAPAVVMPSAQQLAAAMTHSGSVQPLNSVVAAQHDEVVGKVLADALHGGGGSGPNLDALIDSLPNHAGAGGNAGLESFASLASGAVPITHIPGAGAFGGLHTMLSVEMVMHADAHPAAAHG